MDPYTEDVIRQSERDIARLGTKQQQGVRDRAVELLVHLVAVDRQ